MMALALAEDSLSKRQRCDEVIDELGKMPEKMRAFMQVGQGGGWLSAGHGVAAGVAIINQSIGARLQQG